MFGTFTTMLAVTCIASGGQLSDCICDNWQKTVRFNTADEGTKIGPKVTVVDCPKCECLARYADDGKSATVNRARFSGEDAITAAVRRAEMVLAANIVPDEAVRPLMGWSSWNCFALEIDEEKIVSQAVAMASNGLKQAGFLYINTDDGFFDGHDEKGNLKWNLKRFPKGMKPVVDGIHAQGLKAGIYSDAGADMCGGSKGSGLYGHDAADCDLHFKQLGFDYIKVDYCGGLKLKLDERERYTEISKAIRATRRDVKFNICRWAYPGTWAADVADSWRVTGDIRASWKSVRQTFLVGLPLSAYASRGHYNDLDMLEIGHAPGWKPTFDGDAGLTADEEIAHFGLWCIQSSPLVLGCDLRTMPQSALDLVTNPYLLAMNANDLGLQAYPVRHEGEVVTLVKDAGERYGLSRYVAVVNLGDVAAKADLRLADLDLGGRAYVVDLVAKAEIGSFEKSMSLTLKPHSAKFYRLFADRRLDRCVYRADCAWMRRYHKLSWSDDAPMYQVVQPGPGEDGDRVDAVFGLGRHADNDLLWKDVRVSEAGTYELSFTVLADAPRRFSVGVGGQPPVQLTVPAKRWTQKISCRLYLAAGTHAVRIFNDSAPAPGIVEMSLKRIDGQHEATDKETEVVGSVGTESFGYLSWNIGHYAWGKDWKSTVKPEDGACRAEAYRAFLEKIGADVVGLCEYAEDFTANGSMKASAAVFGGYPNSSIGPSRSYQWNAQFWRGFKVLEKKTVDYAERHQQVYYQATRLLIGSRDVWIVQTHLDWTTFKKGFEHCRERQMQKLIDDFRDQPRVVISGDFNVGDRGSNGVRREKTIPAPEEYDVFVRAGYTLANASGTPTCPSDNPTQPLDNIIVKGLDVSQVRFHPAGDLSDHNAVSCTLTLRPVAE